MNRPIAFVVEDDPDIGEIFTAALCAADYQPVYLKDGLEALDRLRRVTPELVVLDLHLPKLAGVTLLRAIRSDTRMSDTYIIVVTADADLAENVEGDADAVLVKPVGFTRIRDLAARRLQQGLSQEG